MPWGHVPYSVAGEKKGEQSPGGGLLLAGCLLVGLPRITHMAKTDVPGLQAGRCGTWQ